MQENFLIYIDKIDHKSIDKKSRPLLNFSTLISNINLNINYLERQNL